LVHGSGSARVWHSVGIRFRQRARAREGLGVGQSRGRTPPAACAPHQCRDRRRTANRARVAQRAVHNYQGAGELDCGAGLTALCTQISKQSTLRNLMLPLPIVGGRRSSGQFPATRVQSGPDLAGLPRRGAGCALPIKPDMPGFVVCHFVAARWKELLQRFRCLVCGPIQSEPRKYRSTHVCKN